MTRQWVRIVSGKGAGSFGFIVRNNWPPRSSLTTIVIPDLQFPKDVIMKRLHTFERLNETECMAMELKQC